MKLIGTIINKKILDLKYLEENFKIPSQVSSENSSSLCSSRNSVKSKDLPTCSRRTDAASNVSLLNYNRQKNIGAVWVVLRHPVSKKNKFCQIVEKSEFRRRIIEKHFNFYLINF